MKIHEYQAKRLFAKYDIPIPEGGVAETPEEARKIAARLGVPVVVKAQVLVGGRGKAGGIRLSSNPDDAASCAAKILGMEIKGLTVKKVLIDEAADIQDELYLGVVLDRANRRVVMMGSSEGGVDIEEVAASTPEKIVRATIDPLLGLRDFQARELAYGIGLDKNVIRAFGVIAHSLYRAYMENDASLAEINPLVVTGDGKLLAVDGKMNIDDSGLFRHLNIEAMRDIGAEDESERHARAADLSYVELDGEIGCMVNGAGLAMATMDIVKLYGSEPANFLDIGGGAQAEKVAEALRIILRDPRVKAVLFNIFGGITRGDEVACGILEALEELDTDVPMVARIVGTRAEEGRQLLADAEMITAGSLRDAAQKAVAAARGELG
ncbi:MAG: Succinate--CoA ligase [GDP-forming] subunit beta [Anaerolineales bacterium]|nr:Succinate--CoA ligase [GDP-forming] subunit beta [Anaerolineales bacterium]